MQFKAIVWLCCLCLLLTIGCHRSFELQSYVVGSETGDLEETWGDLRVRIVLEGHCEDHFNRLILSKKTICREPYTLRLKIKSDVDSGYNYMKVNFVEILYSSGEKVVLQKNTEPPLKIFFKQYSNARSISYLFKDALKQPHQDGQELKVSVSLTLMPDNKTKLFTGVFRGRTSKYKLSLKEQIEGI